MTTRAQSDSFSLPTQGVHVSSVDGENQTWLPHPVHDS